MVDADGHNSLRVISNFKSLQRRSSDISSAAVMEDKLKCRAGEEKKKLSLENLPGDDLHLSVEHRRSPPHL